MKFLIDKSARIVESKCTDFPDHVLGQLLTPLTRYAYRGGVYAIDNGAFSSFEEKSFKSLLARQDSSKDKCLFVTCPDIVGSAQRTIELFNRRRSWIPDGWPVAMVAQDGAENIEIPWDCMDAIFIGGRDPWKDSQASVDIVKTAKILGKWVHVGRVNTPRRFYHFAGIGADSCDGSGVAMYDHMLDAVVRGQSVIGNLFDIDT